MELDSELTQRFLHASFEKKRTPPQKQSRGLVMRLDARDTQTQGPGSGSAAAGGYAVVTR
jgi:hypothetical protein